MKNHQRRKTPNGAPEPMELEQLLEKARALLAIEAAALVAAPDDAPNAKFFLFDRQGGMTAGIVDGPFMGSSQAKDVLSRMIKELARKTQAIAVCFFSDVYFGKAISEEAFHEMRRLNLSVVEAGERGLVTHEEALMLTVETREHTRLLRQMYTREGGKVILGELDDGLHDGFAGRFSHLLGTPGEEQ